MRIPIVFATDENYLFFTCVAITSMAKSARTDTFYQIYILISSDFVDSSHLLDKLQQRYKNIHIKKVLVDEKIFRNVIIHNTHVTKATFYRLVLCDLIEEEKCLYLDGDIIVTEDIQNLYQTDLGDNYLAGCRDIWIDLLSDKEREERRRRTGIPSMDQYVNAGVLLFNLKKMRSDGMNKTFMEYLGQDYLFEDQDILNVCCYNKIVRLPAKWNLFTLFMGQCVQMREAGIEEDTLKVYQERSGIIHYATPMIRPWKRMSCWLDREWWEIAKEWDNESVFQDIKKRVYECEQKNRWDYYLNLFSKYNRIVIFGYTKYSEQLCDWIRETGAELKLAFCDNNVEKQGENYKGVQIFSFADIMKWDEGNSLACN